MRLPLWYVLASDGEAEHRNLVLASVQVLRYVDPPCRVGLVLDRPSAEAAKRAGIRFSDYFDDIRIDDTAMESAIERSRSLKLRLRLETTGDFCYVDSDTLAVRPLTDFPKLKTGVGMVYDYIPGHPNKLGPPESAAIKFEKIGWPYPVPRYFNGGVIVWLDQADAYLFAETWYNNWQISVAAGVPQDQPALGHTDRLFKGLVSVLPSHFNAQINAWSGFAKDATIWHFFHSQTRKEEAPVTILSLLLENVSSNRPLQLAAFDVAKRLNYPWVCSQGFLSHLRTGNYLPAAGEIPKSAARFLARIRSRIGLR